MHTSLPDRLGIAHPIIQAPMAGVSTAALAAAVSNAGSLGSIAVGAGDAVPSQVASLHAAGTVLMATATSPQEARSIEAAGIDVVIAQGIEAGGHRGTFDPAQPDAGMGTFALVQLVRASVGIPIVAAGGIMDGRGIAAALRLGASAAQLGTAFILAPESAATPHHRALLRDDCARTAMTDAISGRAARGIVNRYFDEIGGPGHPPVPDYPIAYDAAKALQPGLLGELGRSGVCAGARHAGSRTGGRAGRGTGRRALIRASPRSCSWRRRAVRRLRDVQWVIELRCMAAQWLTRIS
jgi:NAD(P)H-dependent flavin oxidoreductase YrpB (nitropropane dioxygenase family)